MNDDLISRQAAIDAFDIPVRIIDTADVIKTLLAIPSAQQEQRWIPVTERLPEENKPVLVTNYGKYQAFVSAEVQRI